MKFDKQVIWSHTGKRERAAALRITHHVTRGDLIKAAIAVITDLTPWHAEQDDIEASANRIDRDMLDRRVREMYECYGSIYFETEHDINVSYEMQPAVLASADAVVDRLYPEIHTVKASA